MHLAQALTFSPEGKVTACKLGCCLRLAVGLYFVALKRTRDQIILPLFSQISQTLDIVFYKFANEIFLVSHANMYYPLNYNVFIIDYFLKIGKTPELW